MGIVLKIYDKSGKNAVKTYEAAEYDLMFGTVMSLMELLKIEEIDDQLEMLKTVHSAWSEVRAVLSEVFPEATDGDWKHVKVKELLPVILDIAKFAVSEVFSIPNDPKN